MTVQYWNDIIILRCCRDWPIHRHSSYGLLGRCGLCRQVPELVDEIYPEASYFINKDKKPLPS